MIIWGKVIGGLTGLIFYGPVGLVLGLVFGQIFDNGLKTIMYVPRHSVAARTEFFKSVFQTMGYIAKTDGIISENEIKVARDIMLHDFNLTEAQTRLAIQYFNEGKEKDFDLANVLDNFKLACQSYPDLIRFFLELQVKAAMADKVLRESERGRLVYICSTLNIPLSELDYLLQSYGYAYSYSSQHSSNYFPPVYNLNNKLAEAYKLLGVQANDNNQTIKSAYRRLISKYHPDKLFSKGVPPEMMRVAKEKTQQITVAYDLIMQSRK